jgi:excisionase family DNA binding protein
VNEALPRPLRHPPVVVRSVHLGDVVSRTANPTEALALSSQQVAAALQCSQDTVQRMVAAGLLRRVPHMKHIRISVAELDRYLNSGDKP